MASRAITLLARRDAALARAAELETAALRAALVECSGSLRGAAALLGWSEKQVQRRLDATGLAEWNREAHPYSGRQPTTKGST